MGEVLWTVLLFGACLSRPLAAATVAADPSTASLDSHPAAGEYTQAPSSRIWGLGGNPTGLGYQRLWQPGLQAAGAQASVQDDSQANTEVLQGNVQASVQASIKAVQRSVASLAGRLARMEEKLRRLGVAPVPATSGLGRAIYSAGTVSGNADATPPRV